MFYFVLFIVCLISTNVKANPLNPTDYEQYTNTHQINWPDKYIHRYTHDEWRIEKFKKLFIEDPDAALKKYLERLCRYWAHTNSFYLIPHHIETLIIFKNCFEKAFQDQAEQLKKLNNGVKAAIENLKENHLAHYLEALIDYPDLIYLIENINFDFDIDHLFKLTIETAADRKDDRPIKYLLKLLANKKIILKNKDQYINMLIKHLPEIIEKKCYLYHNIESLLQIEQEQDSIENPILNAFIEGAILYEQHHHEYSSGLKHIFHPNPTDNILNYAIKHPEIIKSFYKKFKEANAPLLMRYLWNGLINNSNESYVDQNSALFCQQICDYFQINLDIKKQNILNNFWFIYIDEIQKLSKNKGINLPETIKNEDCDIIKELLFSFIVPTASGSSIEHIKTKLSTMTYDLFNIKLDDNDRDFRKKLFGILLHSAATSAYEQHIISPQSLYYFFRRDIYDVPFPGFYTIGIQLWDHLENEFIASQEIPLKQRFKALKDRVHFLIEQKNPTLWDGWIKNIHILSFDPLLAFYIDNIYEAYRATSSFEKCLALRRNIELQKQYPDLDIIPEWNSNSDNLYRAYSTKLTKELNNIDAQVIDQLKHCKIDADANILYGIELDILDNKNLNFYTCDLKDGFAHWFFKFDKNDILIDYEDDIYKHFQYCFDQKNVYLILMKNELFTLFIIDKKTGELKFSKNIDLPSIPLTHMCVNDHVLFITQNTHCFENSKKSFLTLLKIIEDISDTNHHYKISQKIQEDISDLNLPDCKIYNNYMVLYNKLSCFVDENAIFRLYNKNGFLTKINIPLIKVNDEIMWCIIDDLFIYKKTTEKNEVIYRYIHLKKKNKIEADFENNLFFNKKIDKDPEIKSHIVSNASRDCVYLNEGQKIKIIDLLKE